MKTEEGKNTRYYVDLDLRTQTILNWNYDQKDKIKIENPAKPFQYRLFITKGQYNKLQKKYLEVRSEK